MPDALDQFFEIVHFLICTIIYLIVAHNSTLDHCLGLAIRTDHTYCLQKFIRHFSYFSFRDNMKGTLLFYFFNWKKCTFVTPVLKNTDYKHNDKCS